MKPALALLLILAATLLAVTRPPLGHAQTATTTPVTTPTAGATSGPLPAAADLMASMVKAMKKQASVHEDVTITVIISGGSDAGVAVANESSNISQRNKKLHSIVITKDVQKLGTPVTVTPETEETISVGSRSAVRRDGLPWQCTTDKSLSYGLAGSSGDLQLATLGSEAIGAAPVWHVHGSGSSVANGDFTLDYYIAQKNSRLVRVAIDQVVHTTSSVTGEPQTVELQIMANYSRYGEKVSATLPKVCKTGIVAASHSYLAAALDSARRGVPATGLSGLPGR